MEILSESSISENEKNFKIVNTLSEYPVEIVPSFN